MSDPACAQFIGEHFQVGVGSRAIAQDDEERRHALLQQADRVREEVNNALRIWLRAHLSHDVALERWHRLIRPGERDLDEVMEERGLGSKCSIDGLVRDSSSFRNCGYGGSGIATRDEKVTRRRSDGLAGLCGRRLASRGVVAAFRRSLDRLVHSRYHSTYSPDIISDEFRGGSARG